jgi:hypothetical protein
MSQIIGLTEKIALKHLQFNFVELGGVYEANKRQLYTMQKNIVNYPIIYTTVNCTRQGVDDLNTNGVYL